MHLPRSQALYNEQATVYQDHAQESPYNVYYDRPAVLGLVGDVDQQRVLDAGCGPGVLAAELLARGACLTCCDQSAEMVRLAQRRVGERAAVRRHDLNDPLTWLPDSSMDLVVLALVLHYLRDRVQTLREFHRILTPSGRLVLSTGHPTSVWRIHGGSYFTSGVVEEAWTKDLQVRYWRQPLERWCAEFAAAGFVIERLVEPRPAAAMAERHPEDHERLSREPGFIAFRLSKAA